MTPRLPLYVRATLDEEQVKLVFPKPVGPRLLAASVLGLGGMTGAMAWFAGAFIALVGVVVILQRRTRLRRSRNGTDEERGSDRRKCDRGSSRQRLRVAGTGR